MEHISWDSFSQAYFVCVHIVMVTDMPLFDQGVKDVIATKANLIRCRQQRLDGDSDSQAACVL